MGMVVAVTIVAVYSLEDGVAVHNLAKSRSPATANAGWKIPTTSCPAPKR